jgi:hypothetical protein
MEFRVAHEREWHAKGKVRKAESLKTSACVQGAWKGTKEEKNFTDGCVE